MNRLTKVLARMMRPEAALIVYGSADDYGRKDYFLESRSIGRDGLMGAGKPVSLRFVRSLAESFTAGHSSVPHGEIPKRLLYADTKAGTYVWHSMPCRKYLYFVKSLNIPDGEYPVPGLIWKVSGGSLSLFAYRAKRLTVNARLCAAPFFNVRPDNGNVCLGNAPLKMPEEPSFAAFIKCWEERFFLSEFSHLPGGNPAKSNLVAVLGRSGEVFDTGELITVKKLKLKNLVT